MIHGNDSTYASGEWCQGRYREWSFLMARMNWVRVQGEDAGYRRKLNSEIRISTAKSWSPVSDGWLRVPNRFRNAQCRKCFKPIQLGSLVRWRQNSGALHTECFASMFSDSL